jgi:hypothetical protein
MSRKAAIIALIITSLYLIFGQLFIVGDFGAFVENYQQPDWSMNPLTMVATQIALYVALGYMIYRNMVVNELMIKPTILLLIVTFMFWETFKLSLFDWQIPFLTFFLLICYIVLLLLLNLFLFREDGLAGMVCVPVSLFSILYVAPWYYQTMLMNTASG